MPYRKVGGLAALLRPDTRNVGILLGGAGGGRCC